MCCCPIRCIQCIVVTVAFIMLVVGSITIGSSVYAKNNQFLIYAGDSTTISIIALVFGIMTALVSLFGIYGGFKRNRACLLIFAINLICIFVVEISLTIAIFKTRNQFQSQYGDVQCPNPIQPQLGSNQSNINKLIELYRIASENLCTEQCPCDYQYAAGPNMSTTQDQYIVAFQQCANYNKKAYQVQANLMAAVEATYQCSGICFPQNPSGFPNLFYFSDVNNNKGTAKGLCDDEIWSFIKYSSNWGGGMTAGMAALSLISFVVLMFLCFHPNKAQYWQVPRDEDQI